MAETVKKIEYHVKEFMYGLGLRGSALTVYAALYSFSCGERGLYHGSAAYLAEGLSISVRTVRRAYAALLSLGLIERYVSEDGRYSGVRCVEPRAIKKKSSVKGGEAEKSKSDFGAEASRVAEADFKAYAPSRDAEAADGEEKYNIMIEDELSLMPEHKKNSLLMMYKYEKPGEDRRRFMSFGLSGGVRMTEPQYRRLLDLLPSEELQEYLVKLEVMLDENLKTGRKPPHSHYRVIKKWIEEDLRV